MTASAGARGGGHRHMEQGKAAVGGMSCSSVCGFREFRTQTTSELDVYTNTRSSWVTYMSY